jgi:hypothetical protein
MRNLPAARRFADVCSSWRYAYSAAAPPGLRAGALRLLVGQAGHDRRDHLRRDVRMGVQGMLVYCADYRCSHSISLSADQWPDDRRLSNIEHRFFCDVCGKRGADVRPDFNWNRRRGP